MAKITESTLKEQLKSGKLCPFYFLYGDEDYLASVYADRVTSTADGPFADFNISKFPETASLNEPVSALCQLPVMGQRRVVALYNPDIAKFSEKDLEDLENYLKSPCESSVLLIYLIGKGVGNSSQSKKLTALATKYGGLLKFGRMTRSELIKILCTGAAKRGSDMPSGAACALIDCCGDDLNTLNTELEKLCAFASGRSITERDIALLCPRSINQDAFDMIREINSGNAGGALTVLGRLFAARQEPIVIFGALVYSYVNLYRIAAAQKCRISLEQAAKDFGMKSAYPLTKSRRDAEKLGEEKIRKSLELLDDCDKRLKSTSADGRLVLEQAIVKLFEISRGKTV